MTKAIAVCGSLSYERFADSNVAPKPQCSFGLVFWLVSMCCLFGLATILCFSIIEKINGEGMWRQTEDAGNSTTTDISHHDGDPSEQPRIKLVESLPLDIDYGPNATFGTPLFQAWRDLLSIATTHVEVASFYWSLTAEDILVNASTDGPGKEILQTFKELPSKNVSVRVVASQTCMAKNSTDLNELQKSGVQVRKVDFHALTKGVLHSKFWIIDRRHVYIGSANMDWRSLTQVKELGVVIYNCSRLAHDLLKIFGSYWMMAHKNTSIPDPWPANYDTSINHNRPLVVNLSDVRSAVYIAASPPAFCPESRTGDLDSILATIKEAQRFIFVAVMDYYPTSQFSQPPRYWPDIDDALREAAYERGVKVHLLVSCSLYTSQAMLPFLQSLNAMSYPRRNVSIVVRAFVVPVGNHSHIPYTRLNHNKYMVTDKTAYIGTSNWSEEYFTTTAGVGIIVSQNQKGSAGSFHQQLKAVFLRDWHSPFAVPLGNLHQYPGCRMSSG